MQTSLLTSPLESASPAILAWLDTPFTIEEGTPALPPEHFHSLYSRQLAQLGLDDKATRADAETAFFKWYRDIDRQTWRQHAANAMLRTMPYYAKQMAEEQYCKNLPLEDHVSDSFSRVTFYIKTWDIEESKRLLSVLRALTSKFLPKSLDKIGIVDNSPTLKILHTQPLTLDVARKIQSLVPAGVKFQYSNHQKEYFRANLRSVTSSDLVTTDAHRADLEAILGRTHQTKLHKFSKEERSKFVYTPPEPYTNLSSTDSPEEPSEEKKQGKPVPKNPITGKPAVWVSGIVSESVKASDIQEHEWTLLT